MNFDEVWKRIKRETELKRMNEVAEIVGVTPAYVSKKKKENDFPGEWAYKIGKKFNISTDWIMDGKERKNNDLFKEIENWVIETGGENKQWFEKMFINAFPQFEAWRKEKKENGKNSKIQNKKIA